MLAGDQPLPVNIIRFTNLDLRARGNILQHDDGVILDDAGPASVRAGRVMLLSVKSMALIKVNVATIEAGIASAEMITARMFLMKNMTTAAAANFPRAGVPRARQSTREWSGSRRCSASASPLWAASAESR